MSFMNLPHDWWRWVPSSLQSTLRLSMCFAKHSRTIYYVSMTKLSNTFILLKKKNDWNSISVAGFWTPVYISTNFFSSPLSFSFTIFLFLQIEYRKHESFPGNKIITYVKHNSLCLRDEMKLWGQFQILVFKEDCIPYINLF